MRLSKRAFFELLGESAAAAEGYKFTAEEIKETAFRIDGKFFAG
nr:DUF2887 domain-containing protein [Oscillatoria sp. PCC 10802]